MRHTIATIPAMMLASALPAPIEAAADRTAAVLAAEDAYTRAVVGHDVAALAATLSDDLIYIHASGVAQTKRAYVVGTVDAGFPVVAATIKERRASVFGTIGITYGTIAYDVGAGGKPAGYMAVYRREGGHWLLLRWQNARRMPA